jgi:hypothetical protein
MGAASGIVFVRHESKGPGQFRRQIAATAV